MSRLQCRTARSIWTVTAVLYLNISSVSCLFLRYHVTNKCNDVCSLSSLILRAEVRNLTLVEGGQTEIGKQSIKNEMEVCEESVSRDVIYHGYCRRYGFWSTHSCTVKRYVMQGFSRTEALSNIAFLDHKFLEFGNCSNIVLSYSYVSVSWNEKFCEQARKA